MSEIFLSIQLNNNQKKQKQKNPQNITDQLTFGFVRWPQSDKKKFSIKQQSNTK